MWYSPNFPRDNMISAYLLYVGECKGGERERESESESEREKYGGRLYI